MDKNTVIDKLFQAGAHFGYAPSRRHPSQKGYIFGEKGGTELFDLEKTAASLGQALAFVKTLAEARKTILSIGGKAEARVALERAAQRVNQPFVASRYIGGTLTNFSEIRRRLNRLQELSDMRETGEVSKFTKHERLLIDREIGGLEKTFGGLRGMQKIPDALLVIDPRHEAIAVAEGKKLGLPIIALMNTDCDRANITYPIPANDSSIASISLILQEIAQTYTSNLGVERPAEVSGEAAVK